ncbi:MAG: sugar transferase [Sphingopyxis sp.]|nr:MAG: sugar transferase [Sphingopyxis sp.]
MTKPLLFADPSASEIETLQSDKAFVTLPTNELEPQLVRQHSLVGENVLANLGKKRNRRSRLIACLAISDVVAIVCSFVFAFFVRLGFVDSAQLSNVLWAILPVYFAIALNNKAYQSSVLTDLWKIVIRSIVAFLMAASAMLLILFFFKSSNEFSRMMFGIGTLSAAVLLTLFRTLIFQFSKKYIGKTPYADLCIYDDIAIGPKPSEGAIEAIQFDLVADPSDAAAVKRLGQLASGMDHVIVHCPTEKRERWVFMLRALDVKSEIVVPELNSINALAIRRRNQSASLLISAGQLRWDQKLVKRIFDIAVASIALIIAFPILIVVAIIIKIESCGPIIFKQERIGLGNRTFQIYKFRSMRTEFSDARGAVSTARDDVRVTKFGSFLRRTSIDELPQLYNVLRSDMSFVGPRPHAIASRAENALFWDIDHRYWHRHVVKPGLTGLAQIRGFRGATERRSDLSNRLHSDLEYVAHWSLFGDIKIIIKTFLVLFHKNAF